MSRIEGLLLLLMCVVGVFSLDTHPAVLSSFSSWMTKHGKTYASDNFLHRLNVYRQNLEYIERFNKENHTYTLAMNHFGDLTHEEFLARMGSQTATPVVVAARELRENEKVDLKGISNGVDWTDFMTPVKDQGACESSAAFAATGTMEGWLRITHKVDTIPNLSEQDIVDCATGCSPGWGKRVSDALNYLEDDGPALEADYPYQSDLSGTPGTCRGGVSRKSAWKPLIVLPVSSEAAMFGIVSLGPVGIQLNVDDDSFQFYSGGVYSNACADGQSHGMVVVGYGYSNGMLYWKLKNSWGNWWGEAGYMRIKANSNLCGIGLHGAYPTFV